MRLLFVPQYPSKLRYQEWFSTEFPNQLGKYFDEIKVIEGFRDSPTSANPEDFSPIEKSIRWETQQVNEYMNMEIRKNDIILINDISFPGIFPNILYHKRPNKIFFLCHGTSINYQDYFLTTRDSKWMIESAHAELATKVFVATEYHAEKLGWKNAVVTRLPYPPIVGYQHLKKKRDVISVARPTPQKVNTNLEILLRKSIRVNVERSGEKFNDWDEYFKYIGESKIMFISAREETFGYQVVDAIINNCIPIAPHSCSYPELLPREYLYKDDYEAIALLDKLLYDKEQLNVPKLKCDEEMKNFYEKIAFEMKGC